MNDDLIAPHAIRRSERQHRDRDPTDCHANYGFWPGVPYAACRQANRGADASGKRNRCGAAIARGTIPSEAIDRVEQERVIVVADDSISVRKFVGRMLEKNGYRVKLAADGLEAAELVTQHGCHLVITDLEMPRMTGYELMVQLRQSPSTRRIPVMVVTSRAGAKHRDRAMKEGATAFLTKPVQEDQLIAAVEQLIGTEAPRPVAPVA